MAVTTLGQILINEKLPEPLRKHDRVLDKKALSSLMTQIGKDHKELYPTIAKDLKDIGDKYATQLGSSFSLDDFKPVDLSHVYKKYDKEFADARKITNEVKKETAFKGINARIEKEVNEKVQHDIKNSNNRMNEWISSGAKGKPENIRQMRYSVGNQVNVKNQIFPYYAFGNLSSGLSPSDFFIGALGARKGVVGSFISVREPGAFAKELFTQTNDMVTTMQDCGTHDGDIENVHSKDILTMHLCEEAGGYPRNTLITQHVQDDLIRKNIQTVKIRNPLHCKAREGVCSMCIGLLENGKYSHVGDAIGLRSAQSLTEPLTQMALSSKHSGGVVGKKTAFETVKQLLHVPESFPGAAVLSLKDGLVSNITKTPDGGHNIYIDDLSHYVLPTQTLNVKVGEKVSKGHALTDGLINPAKIVEMKGMQAGRSYLSDKLREVYADNGSNGHKKIFQVVTKSIMNLAKVDDSGDHHDKFHEGDVVRYNQNLHLTEKENVHLPVSDSIGYRLTNDITLKNKTHKAGELIDYDLASKLKDHKIENVQAYKNPAKISPFMMGLERAALHKGDWLSNMGYRFVKNQLLDNIAVQKSTNLHSYDPIPSYVSGNFSYQPDGRY